MLLKFLAALAVLLAIDAVLIFEPPFAPIPREGSKPAAQATYNGNGKSQNKKQPSPPQIAVDGTKQPVATNANAKDIETKNNEQQEVKIVGPTDVSIAKDYRGWIGIVYDWGPWAFSFGLVIVGAFQVWLLFRTRDQIKRQADTMETQAADAKESGKHTEELAKQAVRQADLTKLQLDISHRPWIAIESIAVASDLTFNEQGCILILNLQIRNVGGSIAKHVINFVDYAVGGVTDIRDVTAKVIEVLKRPIPPELDHGKLLFPGEADLSQYPVVIRPEHVETALKSGHFKDQEGIGFELVVCFDYQSTIDPGVHHQTRRTYGVAEIPEGGGALMGIFRPSVKVYPAQRIAIFYRGYGAHVD